jgi:dipeptidase
LATPTLLEYAHLGVRCTKQVAIGESTCGTRFWAGPLDEDCQYCSALFDISELSRIAMERAATAREAIQVMGDLAVEHGFYGSEWDPNDNFTYLEVGIE